MEKQNKFLSIRCATWVVCALFVALIFCACKKKAATSTQSHQGEINEMKDNGPVTPTKTSAKTTIEMYYYKQENQDGLKRLIDKFEESHGDIHIRPFIIPNDGESTMASSAHSGKLPALIQTQTYSRVREYAKLGYLVDLTEIDAQKKVYPFALPPVTYNGRQYALAMDFSGIGIIYNKSIFHRLGITPPKTYTELKNICDLIKSNGITPFAGMLKENWSVGQFIVILHSELLADAAGVEQKDFDSFYNDFVGEMNAHLRSWGDDIDKDKLFEILDFYRDNMENNAPERDGGDQQRSFANGESAMMVQGLWSYIDAVKFNPALDAGFIPFPVFDDPKKNMFFADNDSTFSVSTHVDTAQRAAAIEFLNWLSSDEGKKAWIENYRLTHSFHDGDFSTLGEPFANLMAEVSKNGSYPWVFNFYPTEVYENACKNGAQQYLFHLIDAEGVISLVDKSWKETTRM